MKPRPESRLNQVHNRRLGQWIICHNHWCAKGETSIVATVLTSGDDAEDEAWANEIVRRFNAAPKCESEKGSGGSLFRAALCQVSVAAAIAATIEWHRAVEFGRGLYDSDEQCASQTGLALGILEDGERQ